MLTADISGNTSVFPPRLEGERITKSEFAEYFRITKDSSFLEKMFANSGNDFLTYQQFSDFAVLFRKGQLSNDILYCFLA